jgi:hypothetical protein
MDYSQISTTGNPVINSNVEMRSVAHPPSTQNLKNLAALYEMMQRE